MTAFLTFDGRHDIRSQIRKLLTVCCPSLGRNGDFNLDLVLLLCNDEDFQTL